MSKWLKQNWNFIAIGVIIIIALVGFSAVMYNQNNTNIQAVSGKSKETIKIGLSFPLTGEAASFGEGMLGGAELAAKEINDAGGIDGKMIELIPEDDRCSSDGVDAFNKLVKVDNVVAIIGPLCSAAAGPALPIAQESGTPVIFWASAPHLTSLGDYLFRNYYSDSFQGRFAAEYMYEELNLTRVAVIYVQNDWGQGIRDVFVSRFQELGGKIVYEDGIQQESRDMRTEITKAKQANPDGVYFPVYPANGAAGLSQMKELGLNVTVLGGDAFDGVEVVESSGAEGTLYTIGKINNPEEFIKRVKDETGKTSVSFTPFAYDAIYILKDAMEKSGFDKRAIRDEIAKTSRTGISVPLIEFDEKGDLKSAEFEVRIVINKTSQKYQP